MHLRCLVHGHQDLRHWEPGRLFLRCLACGRETPGWTLDVPASQGCVTGAGRVIRCCESTADRPPDEKSDSVYTPGVAPRLATARL